MSSVTEVQEQNRELARRINEEARADSTSPYAGKKVGIANGRVVVVSDDWDDLASRLLQIEPDPRRTFCVEAGVDSDAVEEVWGLSWYLARGVEAFFAPSRSPCVTIRRCRTSHPHQENPPCDVPSSC